MTKPRGSFHPARKARFASFGVSLAAFVGMIGVFNVNAQTAASSSSGTGANTGVQQNSASPAVKVVYVPATPQKPKVVVVHVTKHVRYGSKTVTRQSPVNSWSHSSRTTTAPVPQPAATHVVTHIAPIVQPAQPSQTTSGGSGRP